jgi:hypothetical protein
MCNIAIFTSLLFTSTHLPTPHPPTLSCCLSPHRDSKLNEILRHEHRLSEIFKYVDDKEDLLQLDRKTKEDLQVPHTSLHLLKKTTPLLLMPSTPILTPTFYFSSYLNFRFHYYTTASIMNILAHITAPLLSLFLTSLLVCENNNGSSPSLIGH